MSIFGNRHFVIQAPAPLALTTQKVVDQPLHNLPEGPRLAANGIFILLFPLGPGIFLADGRRRLQDFTAGRQSGSYGRAQLPGQRSDGLFNVDLMVIDCLTSKKIRKLFQDVIANHGWLLRMAMDTKVETMILRYPGPFRVESFMHPAHQSITIKASQN